MRTIGFVMLVMTGIGLGGASGVASPTNGVVIGQASSLLTQEVDCRRYPHRHRGAKPHGIGFGCPKKPRTPSAKKA